MFSLYIVYVHLVSSCFGFVGGDFMPCVSVPDNC